MNQTGYMKVALEQMHAQYNPLITILLEATFRGLLQGVVRGSLVEGSNLMGRHLLIKLG